MFEILHSILYEQGICPRRRGRRRKRSKKSELNRIIKIILISGFNSDYSASLSSSGTNSLLVENRLCCLFLKFLLKINVFLMNNWSRLNPIFQSTNLGKSVEESFEWSIPKLNWNTLTLESFTKSTSKRWYDESEPDKSWSGKKFIDWLIYLNLQTVEKTDFEVIRAYQEN